MKTIKLSELFDIYNGYASNIFTEISPIKTDEYNIIYARPSKNIMNTISGYVKESEAPKIYDKNTIFVSSNGEGSHTYTYVLPEKFINSNNSCVLIPKKEMSLLEKQYYALCITKNRYKFSYGRLPVGDRLANLLVPAEIPDWVYEIEEPNLSERKKSFTNDPTPELNTNSWKEFKYTDIFDTITIGKSIDLNKLEEGNINYVGRTDKNNGITAKVAKYNDQEPYEGNCITVPMVGNALKSTYQNSPFYVSQNILILRSRNLNKYNAMFFNAIIRMDKFRFCYGRTLSIDRFKQLTIKLPATPEGEPDYQFMEDYIKTLPYSKDL